jgi:hypothetical protein
VTPTEDARYDRESQSSNLIIVAEKGHPMKIRTFALLSLAFGIAACKKSEPAQPAPAHCCVLIATTAPDKQTNERSVQACVSMLGPPGNFKSAKVTFSYAFGAFGKPSTPRPLWTIDVATIPWVSLSQPLPKTTESGLTVQVEFEIESVHLSASSYVSLGTDFTLVRRMLALKADDESLAKEVRTESGNLKIYSPQPKLGGLAGQGKVKVKFGAATGGKVPVTLTDFNIGAYSQSANVVSSVRVWMTETGTPDEDHCGGAGYFERTDIGKTLSYLYSTPVSGSSPSLPNNLIDIGHSVLIIATIEELNGSSPEHWVYYVQTPQAAPSTDYTHVMTENGSSTCPTPWPNAP